MKYLMQIRDLEVGNFAIGFTRDVIAHKENMSLDPGAWVDVVEDPDEQPLKLTECIVEVGPDVIEVNGVGYSTLCHEACHKVGY